MRDFYSALKADGESV